MNKKSKPTASQDKKLDLLIRIVLILTIAIAVFFFAVRPMLSRNYYFDSSSGITFDSLGSDTGKDSYDVVVVGDGIDSVSAALGSSRVGAKTLLVCSDKEIGSEIRKTFDTGWSPDVTPTGTNVSSDIFKEIRYKSGEGVNVDNYMKTISDLVSAEKNLEVAYNSKISGVSAANGEIINVDLDTPDGKRKIEGKKFIDATAYGELLKMGDVKYTNGYADIGINDLYPPVRLNFMVSGVDYKQIEQLMSKQSMMVDSLLKQYRSSDSDISISGFNFSDQGNNRVLIEGITVKNLDLENEKELQEYYNKASKECMDLYKYLKLNIEQFKNASGATVAQQFVMPSPHHFNGSYTITLGDILTGKRFSDRISTASRPVTLTMDDGNGYIICNPKIFYIPLRSMIPQGLKNVLMTGSKISCSSLVQGAIFSNSSMAGSGYAAGIISAYSISKRIEIPQIGEDYNLDTQTEVEKVLRKQGIFMSDVKEDLSSITGNWSFPYAEKLINVGLLSAGITNDLKFTKKAKSEDFAYIILNGVSRIAPDIYNYDFDVRIRKYIKDQPLTKDTFAQILTELFGKEISGKNYYEEACKAGLIDDILQKRLKNKTILEYADMYYGAVSAIEKVTEKTMK
jgi:hypothetical protein